MVNKGAVNINPKMITTIPTKKAAGPSVMDKINEVINPLSIIDLIQMARAIENCLDIVLLFYCLTREIILYLLIR